MLLLKSFSPGGTKIGRCCACFAPITFIPPPSIPGNRLAQMIDSLVRVSRRDVGWVPTTDTLFAKRLPQDRNEPCSFPLFHTQHTLLRQTISSTFALFSQSSFHLSLTVLVHYRSLDFIQPSMEFTTDFELESQPIRLAERIHSVHPVYSTGLSPSIAGSSKPIPYTGFASNSSTHYNSIPSN